MIDRRRILLLFPVSLCAAESPREFVRGKLDGGKLRLASGQALEVECDDPTRKVLDDGRLQGRDFEVAGRKLEGARFRIDPIHTRSLFLRENGKRMMVTYWCDICYIRTYSPGVCWCCQENTVLDPREPDAVE